MRIILLFTILAGILAAVVYSPGPALAADAGLTLTQFSNELPGPTVDIDFSKGDWWVGLLFYMFISWMRQRNGKSR